MPVSFNGVTKGKIVASPSSGNQTSKVTFSGSNHIDALQWGVKWGGATGSGVTLTFSMPYTTTSTATFSGPLGQSYGDEPLTATGFALPQQQAVRDAFQAWANVANISFKEIEETSTDVGDFRVAFSAPIALTTAAYTAYPDSASSRGGDIWFAKGLQTSSWAKGSYNFQALMHEIGHGLGLKHPFDISNASGAGAPVYPETIDNWAYTIMSYKFSDFTQGVAPTNAYTPMLNDIAAIQYLYGPNMTFHTGNDTYTFDPASPRMETIWDAGGNDTISIAGYSTDCIIDLQPGHFSKLTRLASAEGIAFTAKTGQTIDGTNNLAIAFDCTIENAVGGNGNDKLTGNSANNQLTGGPGNDMLDGGLGIDTAIFTGSRAQFSLTQDTNGLTLVDNTGREGTDVLHNIERIHFADVKLALDVLGNPTTVLKLLGVTFGPASVANKQYIGLGLSLLDNGMTGANLAKLAMEAAGATTNTAVVQLLWTNLFGSAPTTAQAAPFVSQLNSGALSVGAFGLLAADLDINATNINLIGLQNSWIEYI